MLIAIIPARTGSKGVPGKNIRVLAGRPLIAWTIAAALESKIFDRIIVSTDGHDIATISAQYGAEVITRPPALATDEAPAKAVICHVLETLNAKGVTISNVVYLQPTSPLRSAVDILDTVKLVRLGHFDSAASFTIIAPHPERAFRIHESSEADPVLGHDVVWKPRQARSPQYHLNGAVYVMHAAQMLDRSEARVLYGRVGAHIMPAERAVDIDTLLDFRLCEAILEERLHLPSLRGKPAIGG